jgi:hypothetical protein
LNIREIKATHLNAFPCSHFFGGSTMSFFGQTLKSFSIRHLPNGFVRIAAPISDRSGRHMGTSECFFEIATGKLHTHLPDLERDGLSPSIAGTTSLQVGP